MWVRSGVEEKKREISKHLILKTWLWKMWTGEPKEKPSTVERLILLLDPALAITLV